MRQPYRDDMVIQIEIIKGKLDESQQTTINQALLHKRHRFVKSVVFPDSETCIIVYSTNSEASKEYA